MTLLHLNIFQGLFVVLLHPPALLKLKETGQFVPPSQYFCPAESSFKFLRSAVNNDFGALVCSLQ